MTLTPKMNGAFSWIALVGLMVLGNPNSVWAQDAPADTVQALTEIELRDGTRYVGTVVSETDTEVVLRTLSGVEVTIPVAAIVSRRSVGGRVRDGEFLRFDPNATRLLFAPTGRTLTKGRGYLSAYYVIFGFAAYAPTNRFTIGGGTFLVPQAIGELVYLAPKVQLHQRGLNSASAGVFAGFADGGHAGIVYGVWTRGRPDRAVTLGVGLGFQEGEISGEPVFVIGTESRLGRSTKFVTESYIAPTVEAGALITGAIRFFGERLAADLGLVGFLGADVDGFPAIPWVSFAWNFGS